MKAWKKDQKRLQAELHALRGFVEERFGEIKSEIKRLMSTHVSGAPAAKAKPAKRSGRATRKPVAAKGDAIGALQTALNQHSQKRALASAGSQKDQLLRSLVPLYLARNLKGVDVNSGAISRFWKAHGVAYAGPNAAKALRSKPGHAKKAGSGWAITQAGVKYVESALSRPN